MRSCLGCVEPLPMSSGTEIVSSGGLCGFSHAKCFFSLPCVAFVHLDELFGLCFLKPFLCARMLSTHSSRGRNLENQVDMNLDLMVMSG